MPQSPPADVAVTTELVRSLLAAQHPDLADLPLAPVSHGWDNEMYRLGEDLAVRLPRRQLAATLIEHEQRWLPALGPSLPIPVPVPLRIGRPAGDYPWSWSIVPWFTGRPMIDFPSERRRASAPALAAFVEAMHQPAPADAPPNPYRGVRLADRDAAVRDRIASGIVPDSRRALAVWERGLATTPWEGPALWIHGDLHPGNLIAGPDDALRAVIDLGDLTVGDPATDLGAAWTVFDAEGRETFRSAVTAACGTSPATWERARANALAFATALLASSADNPQYERVGLRTLEAVLDD